MNGRREQTARDSATQLGHITSITEKCQTHPVIRNSGEFAACGCKALIVWTLQRMSKCLAVETCRHGKQLDRISRPVESYEQL